MCKALHEYLGPPQTDAVKRFAARIKTTPATVHRYRNGTKIPRPDAMIRIVRETGGRVMPNDFYDIPARYLTARYGEAPPLAEMAAAE